MTAAQRFLSLDPSTLRPPQLGEIASHWLLCEVPCEYCNLNWVPMRDEPGYYEIGGIEVCDECEAKFQENKRHYLAGEEPLPNV